MVGVTAVRVAPVVPAVMPVPLITEPILTAPEATAVTVRVVPEIEPVNTGV